MQLLKSSVQWFFIGLVAAALNLGLFSALPLLTEQKGEPATGSPIRPVQTVRIKKEASPTTRKARQEKTRIIPQQAFLKPTTFNTLEKKQVLRAPAIAFSVNPQLPDTRPFLSGLAIQNPDLPQRQVSDFYDETDLDTPLSPLVQPPPVYPLRARQNGIEGWVKVSFLVMANGRVTDIEIIDAKPARIFEKCVRKCIAKWRFSPGTIQGESVKVKAITTLRFDLKG